MIQLVVDVNLSPLWIDVFVDHGWPAVHWSTVGDPRAKDRTVMAWARENGRVVFTHDLDFGTLLALTRETGPSVVQVRAHDVLPEHIGPIVITAIRTYQSQLQQGAIVTVDESRGRVRIRRSGRRENSRTHATSGAFEPSRSPDACTLGSGELSPRMFWTFARELSSRRTPLHRP